MALRDYKENKLTAKKALEDRGVTIRDIAELTFFLEEKYVDGLTIEECEHNVERVLMKREVQHAVFTGIELDVLAEKKMLSEPLQTMVDSDFALFGIDEILALSIVNVYGSIGLTNFGYIDKLKPGILGDIDRAGKCGGKCNCFLDDIVGAIAAAAASRMAHRELKDE